MLTTAPYGSWPSPLSAARVAQGEIPLAQVELDGADLYWLEGRPNEGGRTVLMRHTGTGTREILTPEGYSVRSRVHEYGGGAYAVQDGVVFFSNASDQRLYRQEGPHAPPVALTPEPVRSGGPRYADAHVAPHGRWLVCIRELHPESGDEAVNEVVVIPTDGTGEPRVVASGRDFYASPRISADGRRLAWLTWDHPNMPWDRTELWVADLSSDGSIADPELVAGGPEESIFQPSWGRRNEALYFVSDRSGWWNVYRAELDGREATPVAPVEADCGLPQWVFGLATYALLDDGRLAVTVFRDGYQRLNLAGPDGHLEEVAEVPFTSYRAGALRTDGRRLAFIAASPTEPPTVALYDTETRRLDRLRVSFEAPDPASISIPRPVTFPTADGAVAHALYYGPASADHVGPEGERPPLLVTIHGGPTSMAYPELELARHYWTSRGFGVLAVNYRGSTGYGRAYRNQLEGQWGVADVADCVAAARNMVEGGLVDGQRLAIRGGSAGGYTALCALVFHPGVFRAAGSYYGVADLETLLKDTHKFEARYLDRLVGPYPAAKSTYRERSPLRRAHQLSAPVILFQGLDDRVVPPAQAEVLVKALRARGLPHAYLTFEGEAHGFRLAETVERTLEAELYFYSRTLGFALAEEIEPVEIENLSLSGA